MTVLPKDVVADLRRRVAELEQKLQSSSAERDEAIAQLRAAGDRQAGSAEILRTIGSVSGNAERSLYEITETTKRLFEASSVTIFVANGDEWGQIIHDGAGSKRIGAEVPVAQLRIGGHSLPGTAFSENRQIHLPDIDNVDPAIADWPGLPPARAAGSRTISGTPLRRAGQAIGVLIVHRDRLAPFTAEELALLQTFADQAAIAIENARLFNEAKDALERQTATADILKVIASSPSDVQPVFDAIAERANRLIEGLSSGVYSLFDDTIHLMAFTPTSPEADAALQASFPRPLSALPWGEQIGNGDVVNIAEVEAELVGLPALREMARLRGYRSLLWVPLLRDRAPIGLISVTRKEPGTFAAHHVQLLQTFADQAVIAIENVRLFNETQEALEHQTATADILKVIASSPSDVQPVFAAIAERSNRLVDGLSTAVYSLVDDTMHLMAFTPTSPEADAALQASFPRPLSEATWGDQILRCEIVEIPDADAEWAEQPALRELARLRGFRSLLFVPLLRDRVSIGLISVTRKEPGRFAAHHVQLLQTFADQAVIAIGNVRLFDEVQAKTLELSQSLDELRTAQDRLVQTEKLASLGQLTAGIAHEIKNPLNFVNNFSALSAELVGEMNDVLKPVALDRKVREEVDELTAMLKDNLGKVVQHGKRADSIVKNMLQHSREGSGEHRPADINAIVDESLNLAYHGARAEKAGFSIALQRDLDPSVGMADVYPQEITRVLLNLISNGFYATTKRKVDAGDGFEPMLSATTKNLGDKVEIRIRDNGTGIPKEVKEKIFNPFFTTKPSGEGTGLGLSMSHDIIVKQHGGSIDVDTEAGQFTEFKIVLPRTGQK
jgi:two-component system NtrC family sensor kinase